MTLGSSEHGAEQGAVPVAGGLRARFQKLVKEPFRIGRRDLVQLRVREGVYQLGDPRLLRLPSVMMELRPCQVLRCMLAEGHLPGLINQRALALRRRAPSPVIVGSGPPLIKHANGLALDRPNAF